MSSETGKFWPRQVINLTEEGSFDRRRSSLAGISDGINQLSVSPNRPKRKGSETDSQSQEASFPHTRIKQRRLRTNNHESQSQLSFPRTKSVSGQRSCNNADDRSPTLSPERQPRSVEDDVIYLDLSEEELEPFASPTSPLEFPTLFQDDRFLEDNSLTDEEFQAILPTLSVNVSGPRPQDPAFPPTQDQYVDHFPLGNAIIARNKSVELDDGKFLRVEDITISTNGNMVLHGRMLSRQYKVGPMMPRNINELVWQVQVTVEEASNQLRSKWEAVEVHRVRRVRQIVFTNRLHKEMSTSFSGGLNQFFDPKEQREEGLLYCRWKQIKIGQGRKRVPEEAICLLSSDECDDKARGWDWSPRLTQEELCARWRGPSSKGGSFLSETPVFSLECNRFRSHRTQKYTFGDAFCGVGGASCGARMAGLHTLWAFDRDEAAIAQYRANFDTHGVNALQQSVDEFLHQQDADNLRVDVLHMSFPCPAFSAANTTPNEQKNEENQAPLFANGELLRKIRPRIATVEETDGLLNRHTPFFVKLIRTFVDEGYSVRWGILRCDGFGVPQMRKRLCLIAAGYVPNHRKSFAD